MEGDGELLFNRYRVLIMQDDEFCGRMVVMAAHVNVLNTTEWYT